MPCSKPIRRKYSENEVILPSDRWGSMACHAVPRFMMYQGDVRVPLEAEAILVRGLRWWRTEVWNNGCFVRLGKCGIVIWCLISHYYYWAGTSGVRPPAVLHCYLVLDTSTWLLYVPCRRQEVQNSWKGASTEDYTTKFMKGSDLVLEKSVFTEYVPTRVYKTHLKNIYFSVW